MQVENGSKGCINMSLQKVYKFFKKKIKKIGIGLIALYVIALVLCALNGHFFDILGSARSSLKEGKLVIETKPVTRQLVLYQINNPANYKIQHNLTKRFPGREYATFPLSDEYQKFYFGIRNLRHDKANIVDPILTIRFYDTENLLVDIDKSKPWIPSDPEGAYFIRIYDEIHHSITSVGSLPALFVKFKKRDLYKAEYEIRSQNKEAEIGTFYINVGDYMVTVTLVDDTRNSVTPNTVHVAASPDTGTVLIEELKVKH